MMTDYGKMWSDLVACIQQGDGEKARRIWDSVVEDAWKYNDLQD